LPTKHNLIVYFNSSDENNRNELEDGMLKSLVQSTTNNQLLKRLLLTHYYNKIISITEQNTSFNFRAVHFM